MLSRERRLEWTWKKLSKLEINMIDDPSSEKNGGIQQCKVRVGKHL